MWFALSLGSLASLLSDYYVPVAVFMSQTDKQDQQYYHDAAKVIIAMSSICLVASFAILVGCFTARPAFKSRWSTASWILLGTSAAVLVIIHLINIGAAASDLRTYELLGSGGHYSTHRLRPFESPASAFQMLFLIFEILACRIAWYAITRPIDQAKTWRKSMWTFKVLDVLTGLATLAMFLMFTIVWTGYGGLCGEYLSCGTSAQIAVAGDDLFSTLIYDPIVMFHAVLVIAAGFTAIKMLPRSTLARAMLRFIAPTLMLQIVLWIVYFIVQFRSYENRPRPWVAYYASLPHTFIRVGVIAILQYVLRVYPANVDDEVRDVERAVCTAEASQHKRHEERNNLNKFPMTHGALELRHLSSRVGHWTSFHV